MQPVIVEGEFDLPLEEPGLHSRKASWTWWMSGRWLSAQKTTKRTPSEGSIKRDIQVTMYSLGLGRSWESRNRGSGMDYLVRTKTPKTVSLAAPPRQQKDIDRLLKLISYVARAIRDQLYYPNVHSLMCHPKSCGYWDICQERWEVMSHGIEESEGRQFRHPLSPWSPPMRRSRRSMSISKLEAETPWSR